MGADSWAHNSSFSDCLEAGLVQFSLCFCFNWLSYCKRTLIPGPKFTKIIKNTNIAHKYFVWESINTQDILFCDLHKTIYFIYKIWMMLNLCFDFFFFKLSASFLSLENTYLDRVLTNLSHSLLCSVAVGRGAELWSSPLDSRTEAEELGGVEFPVVWLCTSR